MIIGPQGRTRLLQLEIFQEGLTEDAGQLVNLRNTVLYYLFSDDFLIKFCCFSLNFLREFLFCFPFHSFIII